MSKQACSPTACMGDRHTWRSLYICIWNRLN